MKLFESVMWNYIDEEQDVLHRNFDREDIYELARQIKGYKTIYCVSHGSSYNASVTVMPFFRRYAHVNVSCITAGNFIPSKELAALLDPESTLIVLISQTGNSRGTLQSAELAREYHLKTLGISADDSAALKRYTDFFLPLNCGEEDSNAKTKGMSSTILVLLLLATCIGHLNHHLTEDTKEEIVRELSSQCDSLAEVKKRSIEFARNNAFGLGMDHLYIIGSDMNYGLALEAQIKVMETMCIPTCAVDSEEFSHGTHRSVNKDTSLLLIRTDQNGKLAQSIFDYFKDIAKVFMIETGSENSDATVMHVENYPLTESVLIILEFIQIISAYAPELNGLDPNRDANNEFTELVETRI
ncbi:MAG: SIS domain-containing protein [Erysipelotrichaceae bacterium]|nr:SIS domain-containing protein [Erysipelotrichaceae bacterium]